MSLYACELVCEQCLLEHDMAQFAKGRCGAASKDGKCTSKTDLYDDSVCLRVVEMHGLHVMPVRVVCHPNKPFWYKGFGTVRQWLSPRSYSTRCRISSSDPVI